MKKKNLLVTATATVLALTMAFGGTFAYLTATSNEVENDFKTNSNNVELKETTEGYDIVPGTSQEKDPTVTATYTLDSYVYVEVTDNTQELVTYEIADGWTELGSYTNDGVTVTVYYQLVKYNVNSATEGVCTSTLSVLEDNTVYYPSSITNANMDAAENVSLTFQAYIVQANYEGEVNGDNDCVLYGLSLTEYENYTAIVANSKLVTEIAAVAATCNETGLTVGYKCADCDKVLVAQEVVPATGHGYSYVAAVDATCTDEGTTEGYICPDCGKHIDGLKTVGALGHDLVLSDSTDATCVDAGSATYTCTRCDYSYTETIDALGADGHVFGEDGVCTICNAASESYSASKYYANVSSYAEFVAAIGVANATDGTFYITVTGNFELEADVTISGNVDLDLCDYTISENIYVIYYTGNGTLDIHDGTISSASTSSYKNMIEVNGNGTVTLSNLTMSTAGYRPCVCVNSGTLIINSGTYTSNNPTVYNNGGTVIINGGTFRVTSSAPFMYLTGGTTVINGGTFTTSNDGGVWLMRDTGLTIYAGVFDSTVYTNYLAEGSSANDGSYQGSGVVYYTVTAAATE